MSRKSYPGLVASVILILSLFIGGCGPQDRGLSPPSTAAPRGVTGSIKTGSAVPLSDTRIEASGGTITVNKTGDPLNDMKITIPAEAYTAGKQFKVSYAPVESHTFGKDFNPITPLITVDNGGGMAAEVMQVEVPVKVPAKSFAMGFMYDPGSKKLEGMTTVAQDSDSITLATLHFSSFVISFIAEELLQQNIDSGFRPGIDDWQIPNEGSEITPRGNCSGMSTSAMWYYLTRPDGKDAHLYGRYDNNGNKPATPNLWQDDSLAYRFVSMNQYDYIKYSFQTWLYKAMISLEGYNDALNWHLFAYAMLLTKEPQYIGVSKGYSGHAMVCYRVTASNLYIADPNYGGNADRKIAYTNGKFAPYNSALNEVELRKGNGIAYDQIGYMAKSVASDWDKIAQRWLELKNKTIGNDIFPKYGLGCYANFGEKVELKSGLVTNSEGSGVWVTGDEVSRCVVYANGLPTDVGGYYSSVTLKPGNNLLGIFVWEHEYVDFQYVNVTYIPSNIGIIVKPATQEAVPNQTIVFDLELKSGAPTGSHFEWFVDGVFKQKDGFGINVSFPAPDTYTITAKIVDAAGKVLAEGQGSAVIKAPTTTALIGNNLNALQQMKTFRGNFAGQCNIKEKTGLQAFLVEMPNSAWKHIFDITWNGTSFSGTNNIPIYGGTETNIVSGTVSSDGKTLTSLVFTFSQRSTVTASDGAFTHNDTINLQFQNIPINDLVSARGFADTFEFKKTGPEIKSYLAKYEQHYITYLNGSPGSSEMTYLSDTINWNAPGMFDMPRMSLIFSR